MYLLQWQIVFLIVILNSVKIEENISLENYTICFSLLYCSFTSVIEVIMWHIQNLTKNHILFALRHYLLYSQF